MCVKCLAQVQAHSKRRRNIHSAMIQVLYFFLESKVEHIGASKVHSFVRYRQENTSVKSDGEQAGCCGSTDKGVNSSPEKGKRVTDGI